MSAKDELFQKAKSLKKEVEVKKSEETKERASALAKLQDNPELAKLYKESAALGSANLSMELPQLKIHSAGRSTTNFLADGKEPNDGWFFYKPTKEQFETVEAHILSISKGFRSEGLADKKDVFNQIVAGVITNNNQLSPFIMYFTGLRLSYLWDFGKRASVYTKAKPVPVPLFALSVLMRTKKVKHNYGMGWITELSIVEYDGGGPVLIQDPKLFTMLRDQVEPVEDTIASLIASKTVIADTGDGAHVIETVSHDDKDIPFA